MEKTEKDKEEKAEETKEVEQKPVTLGQIATAHELVYMTPEGDLTKEEYLVWLGNEIVGLKEVLIGNK